MSGHDLYLVLRERLDAVADTIHIDTEILDEAQRARGFSHERMARELDISEKTWRRWKAAGAIPTDQLEGVAKVLNLDIERPAPRRVVLAEDATGLGEATGVSAALASFELRLQSLEATAEKQGQATTKALREVARRLARIEALLVQPEQQPAPKAQRARKAANG